MISLSATTGGVRFIFENSSYYLYGNGTIDVPINSLLLVDDGSDAVTFKKIDGDVFISAPVAEFDMSKAEIEEFYEDNMVGSTGGGGGGGDVTSAQVQTMIDASISGKADAVSAVCSAEYVESSTTIDFKNIDGTVISSIDASDFIVDGMIENVSIETISGASYLVIDFNTASGKEDIQIPLTDIFDPSNYYTKQQVDAALSGKADSSAVTASINAAVSGKVDSSSLATVATSGDYDDLLNKPTIPTVPTDVSAFNNDAGYITENAISGKADTSAVTAVNNVLTAHTADTTIHVTSSDKSTWSGKQDALVSGTNIKTINNQSLLGSGNITISGGSGSGNSVVECTQAEYDALVSAGTVDLTAFYIITDAPAVDLSGYAQTSAVTAEITAAVSGKQDTLVSGTNIKTINNESLLGSGNIDIQGGGGSTYTAGTNISIANDTISCTLPITKIEGYNSVIIGDSRNAVQGQSNVAVGYQNSINAKSGSYTPQYCFVGGEHNNVINTDEAAFGKYNNSVQNTSVGGASGTTLFSVGNGTSTNARHNAFEIRQNGDIYISKDGQDVKLQDQLGGGAASSAITSGDTNAVAGGAVYNKFDEVEQVTAVALNALNDNFGGLKLVKLTQQEYDDLAVKNNNTLYVII